MESLLNIVWLMLVLSAVLIWRRVPKSVRISPYLQRTQFFVLLCCLLALLFPVVSATDDLHAAQSEVEESGVAKHTVKQSACSKSPTWGNGGGLTAQLLNAASLAPTNELRMLVSKYWQGLPTEAPAYLVHGRAPPLRVPESPVPVAPLTTVQFVNLDSLLLFLEVQTLGWQQRQLQPIEQRHGIRSFKCKISLLMTSGHFHKTVRHTTRNLRQQVRELNRQSAQKEET